MTWPDQKWKGAIFTLCWHSLHNSHTIHFKQRDFISRAVVIFHSLIDGKQSHFMWVRSRVFLHFNFRWGQIIFGCYFSFCIGLFCPSIRSTVRLSVHPLGCPFVRPSGFSTLRLFERQSDVVFLVWKIITLRESLLFRAFVWPFSAFICFCRCRLSLWP